MHERDELLEDQMKQYLQALQANDLVEQKILLNNMSDDQLVWPNHNLFCFCIIKTGWIDIKSTAIFDAKNFSPLFAAALAVAKQHDFSSERIDLVFEKFQLCKTETLLSAFKLMSEFYDFKKTFEAAKRKEWDRTGRSYYMIEEDEQLSFAAMALCVAAKKHGIIFPERLMPAALHKLFENKLIDSISGLGFIQLVNLNKFIFLYQSLPETFMNDRILPEQINQLVFFSMGFFSPIKKKFSETKREMIRLLQEKAVLFLRNFRYWWERLAGDCYVLGRGWMTSHSQYRDAMTQIYSSGLFDDMHLVNGVPDNWYKEFMHNCLAAKRLTAAHSLSEFFKKEYADPNMVTEILSFAGLRR